VRLALTSVLIPAVVTGALAGAAAAGLSRLFERGMDLPRGDRRWLLLETALPAALLGLIVAQFGPTQEAAIRGLWVAVFSQILFFDLRHRLVLDAIVLPAIPIAILLSPRGQETDLAGSLIGCAALGAAFLVIYIVALRMYGPDAMGLGDVKLAALVGAALGASPPAVNALRATVLGLVLGSLLALAMIGLGRLSRRDTIPLGPFLCAGALVVLILPVGAWWPFG
jgi:leader peptidase (prepilin peptidase)/N-methyltransferase